MKLFVATMGAANLTYAEAVATEGREDWGVAYTRMFSFLGGAPKAVAPDNLKSPVIKPDRMDPRLNRSYAAMAAQRSILVRLRNRRFFTLADLNSAIRQLMDKLSMRVMWDHDASRADLFATLDSPPLQKLPGGPHEFVRLRKAIARTEPLILDAWSLSVLTAMERRDMLAILEDLQAVAPPLAVVNSPSSTGMRLWVPPC